MLALEMRGWGVESFETNFLTKILQSLTSSTWCKISVLDQLFLFLVQFETVPDLAMFDHCLSMKKAKIKIYSCRVA